jgi:mono/diheme cytochrome c family protein
MKHLLLSTIILFALASAIQASDPVSYDAVKAVFAKHCISCHGPQKSKSSLRLDHYSGIRKGSDSGAILVPKKAADSKIVHALLGSKKDVSKMPPEGQPALSQADIALIQRWIDEGAVGPQKDEIVGTDAKTRHWSFQPIKRPAIPEVKDTNWTRNPIDRFILARLEKEHLTPSAEADKVTLIRRLSLDLLGLPPTIAEVDEFLHDTRPDAYDKLVDRLLASPHYGEMQGRIWLDLARYADSNGYSIDSPRSIWKYRDWVINAFNKDMPFDQFTIEQLAGDLLPNPTTEQKVATGFHRNTMFNQEGGIDLEQFRVDSIIDRVNTTGSVWLGLTVGCAQCHDHKFDPLSQRDYYQLFAYFNNCDEPNIEILDAEEERVRKEFLAKLAANEKALKSLDPTTPELVEKWERGITDVTRPKLNKEIKALFDVAVNGRNAKQNHTLETAYRRNDQTRHVVGGLMNPFAGMVHTEILKTRLELEQERDNLKKHEPKVVTTMVLKERKTPRVTNVFLGGDYLRKGIQVGPAVPAVFTSAKPASGANRLDLARWVVSPDNPLTARVAVNRMWAQLFGLGIVETENDFGTQGRLPSHPELLDYLASEFIHQKKWSVKSLQRMIVLSATYRQSAKTRPELNLVDARNQLLARQNRLRVNAEIVRDVSLSASGLLSLEVGGPGVFPPQPDGMYRFTQIDKGWKPSSAPERYRRGMYTYFWRSAPHPALIVFDAPDSTTTCTRRNRSNTPLQALTLLNDSGFYEYAQGLAARVLKEGKGDDREHLKLAFRLCLAREPGDRELKRLEAFLSAQKAGLSATKSPEADKMAWVMVARVLLNLDEFITRE